MIKLKKIVYVADFIESRKFVRQTVGNHHLNLFEKRLQIYFLVARSMNFISLF